MVDCWGATLGLGDDIWVLLVPDPQNPMLDSIAVTNDLDPTFEYTSFSTLYLARLASLDGTIQSITRVPSTWIGKPAETLSPRMVIDTNGRIWIGGYGSGGKLPVTADAADNIPYITGRVGPGTLLRLSPDASRIEYATYLRAAALIACVLRPTNRAGTRIPSGPLALARHGAGSAPTIVSARSRRARNSASSRSFFRLLSLISLTCRARWPQLRHAPRPSSSRLTRASASPLPPPPRWPGTAGIR
jgi:hypothetical protein